MPMPASTNSTLARSARGSTLSSPPTATTCFRSSSRWRPVETAKVRALSIGLENGGLRIKLGAGAMKRASVPAINRVRLLDVEPDLGSLLSPDELALAAQVAVPALTVSPGKLELSQFKEWEWTFGAIVLEGMLLQEIALANHPSLRLLGPGDMLAVDAGGSGMLLDRGYRATRPVRLAVLEEHALLTLRRFPQLSIAFQRRMASQQERLAAQLVICQLPRGEDRVLAMLWLLAESWGRVTSSGTTL